MYVQRGGGHSFFESVSMCLPREQRGFSRVSFTHRSSLDARTRERERHDMSLSAFPFQTDFTLRRPSTKRKTSISAQAPVCCSSWKSSCRSVLRSAVSENNVSDCSIINSASLWPKIILNQTLNAFFYRFLGAERKRCCKPNTSIKLPWSNIINVLFFIPYKMNFVKFQYRIFLIIKDWSWKLLFM